MVLKVRGEVTSGAGGPGEGGARVPQEYGFWEKAVPLPGRLEGCARSVKSLSGTLVRGIPSVHVEPPLKSFKRKK